MSTIALSIERGRGPARRWISTAALVLAAAATGTLLAGVVAMGFGFRVLVDRSDSMLPAIAAGDVVVVRMVRPADVRPGDVVTFRDPQHDGRLITHRVVAMKSEGSRVAFVTRGDANTGVERWGIERGGALGRLALRIPRVGYAVAWLATPAIRIAAVSGGAVLIGIALLRRIWSS